MYTSKLYMYNLSLISEPEADAGQIALYDAAAKLHLMSGGLGAAEFYVAG